MTSNGSRVCACVFSEGSDQDPVSTLAIAPIFVLVAALTGSPPATDARVPADTIGWVHVPYVSRTLLAAEASPLAPLVRLMLGPAATGLKKFERAALLGTAHGRTPSELYGLLALDTGPATATAADAWRRILEAQGFTRLNAPAGSLQPTAPGAETFSRDEQTLTLLVEAGRIGLSNDPKRVASWSTKDPLTKEERFVALHAANPTAHLIARLDVQKLWGVLARGEGAARLAATIDRLGLLGLKEAVLTIGWPDPRHLRSVLDLDLPGSRTGLVAALGEPHPPINLARLPARVSSVTRISVRPAELLLAASKLVNYYRPLAYALFASQLRAIEDKTGESLDADILGHRSRIWTVYRLLVDDLPRTVLAAGITSGEKGRALFGAFVEALPGISPETHVRRAIHHGVEVVIIGGRRTVAVAFTGDIVLVGRSESALVELLRRREEITPGEAKGEPAVISAVIDHAAERELLARSDWLGRVLSDHQDTLRGALGRSTLTLRRNEQSFVFELLSDLPPGPGDR